MRIFSVDRISQHLKFPCKNAGLGCTSSILLSGRNTHESTCPFRRYQCLPFCVRGIVSSRRCMVPHLQSTHPLHFLEGSRQEIDVELNSPTLFYTDWALACFARIFRLDVFREIKNLTVYVSAYLVGGCGEGTPGSGGTSVHYRRSLRVWFHLHDDEERSAGSTGFLHSSDARRNDEDQFSGILRSLFQHFWRPVAENCVCVSNWNTSPILLIPKTIKKAIGSK
jgi:hypothetical protein